MALRRRDLDDLAASGCQVPGCNHQNHGVLDEIYLHGRCHVSAGTEVLYKTADKIIEVRCKKCKAFVAAVDVAE